MTQPCRLEYRGFHQLELVRHGGAEIRIGGRLRALQEPPPNVASRPPVDTVQYVYARWDERRERVKLSASTTGHETLEGEEVMRGDPAALLVGMGRPYESRPRHYHWADRPEHRTLILSRHNRKRIEWQRRLRADAAVSPGEWSEVSPDFAVSFLVWGEEEAHLEIEGRVRSDAASPLLLGVGLDGAPPESADDEITPQEASSQAFSLKFERRFSRDEEGFHTLSLFGKTEDAPWALLGGAALRYSTLG
ncbi:MAG: hypothetical protein OXG62_03610 [Nitrospinae bacterium]|nr:hypothetical protein [Nitrospinota bacterium]